MEELFFIVNPHAGNGKGRKDWPLIESFLKSEKLKFDFVFSEKTYHAIYLAHIAVEKGYRTIIAVGGDGTLNEVANGILKSKKCNDVTLGMIPVGTGNDWCRMYNIPINFIEAIKVIKNNKIFIQDIGLIKYKNGSEFYKRYFVNVAGFGFDADVVKKVNTQKNKGKGGKFLYLLNLLKSLFSFKYVNAEINVDGDIFSSNLFSMNVGICKYSGGGMMQVPNAIADDGLLDVTVINRLSKFEVIRNVKNLYDGSFIKHPKVSTHRGQNIKVNSEPAIAVEADGETLGTSPIEISIIPKALKIISG